MTLSACATTPNHAYGPAPGSYFIVRVGEDDTLSGIAQRYRVDEDDIAAMNRLRDHDSLFVGEVLRVPAYGRVAHATPSKPHSGTQHETHVAHTTPTKPVHVAQNAVPIPRPRPHYEQHDEPQADSGDSGITHVSLPPAEPVHVDPGVAGQFSWPLDGVVISTFGSRSNGERNDGINIACTGGEEIRAAAAGTVTYAGNELKGYGNLVLIKHDNGFTTAYAHADRIAVQKGDRVARGQVIAYAGATGDVSEPQLHFELRHGVTPVDPRPYLRTSGL